MTGSPLGGLARVLGRTVAGISVDLAGAGVRLGELAVDVASGSARNGSDEPAVLRVQVLILCDEAGRPLTTPERVEPSLRAADRILREQAGIRVRVTDVRTITEIAPREALDPRADRALLLDDILGRTAFYRRHAGGGPLLVGAPLTVIVVREIAGHTTGCSLGISADWVIAQASLFDERAAHTYDETVLAHELGHAVNLPHHRDHGNLMFPASSPPNALRGNTLRGWQRSVIRTNRHVVPAVRRGPAPDSRQHSRQTGADPGTD